MRIQWIKCMVGLLIMGEIIGTGGSSAKVFAASQALDSTQGFDSIQGTGFSQTRGQSGISVPTGFQTPAGDSVADEGEPIIPKEAVRLRIIANSDSPEDQALKRQIRDRIIQDVGNLVRDKESREQVRQVIQESAPKFNQLAGEMVKQAGYSYKVQTDYGMVSFPTKIYGNNVYPAGEYEALRIVIGEGQGQNWWCVLFPPLCFVDLANGDAVQAKDMDTKPLTTVQVPTGDNNTSQTVQVRLGILDAVTSIFKKISEFVKSIF